MSINLTPPPGIRGDDRSSLVQMHSFLFRLTEQLNAALNETDRRIQETERVTGISAGTTGSAPAGDNGNPPLTEQYESLKALIIKTADVVKSEMDVIENTLKSEYMAWSDWGAYNEDITNVITQTASGVVENYQFASSLKPLKDQVVDFDSYIVETNGYIRRGIIGYDGEVPIIGIAIGKDLVSKEVTINGVVYPEINMSRSMATYTDDKVTFWQNGVEIAWFSSSELVCRGIRTDKVTLGDDLWEISYTNGFTIKWIGGDE